MSRRWLNTLRPTRWRGVSVSLLALGLSAAGFTLSADGAAQKSPLGTNCRFQGHALYGRIQLVEQFADVEVQVVRHFPDLRVKLVENFPNRCGEWQLVEHHADTTVKLVERFPDVKIRYVEHFPGVP